ncbi:serine/threonine-protein kinase Hrk1p [Monosporozyma unispora]|nr:serine/threonine protein kinase [Kazachstania unispora]
MAILSRNPFHHGHSSSSTHLHEKYDQSNHSVMSNSTTAVQSTYTTTSSNNNNTNSNNNTTNPPPLLKRSSKSFLSFMSRKPSIDSIRSDKSNESNYIINPGHNTPPNHDTSSPRINHHQQQHPHQQQHHHHGNNGSPAPVSHHPHGNHSTKHHPYQSNHGSNSDLHGGNTISPKPTHSMAELKRFFRSSKKSFVNLNHLSTTHTSTPSSSTSKESPLHHLQSPSNHHPYSTTTLNLNAHYLNPNDHKSHTNTAIPPSSDSVLSLSNTMNIYHDDTILAQKYGKLGKTLGSGAGGSVKILVRPTDGATFAVKEFRPRKSNESIKQYAKKCTAEFCIGSSLHHPNVVQTIDIFSDFHQNKYFQVMEFLPVDFFAVVMTGLMSRGEINCCFKQIAQGVRYLHSMGLAHRDLKLDNCVMNPNGILKLIDFGSAVVFRYPFEDDISMAHGIVGSDPYLAPEVITSTKAYDPQYVDIWSMGIIFCCMMLKRFPWKAPKISDDNYRLYSMPDDFPHDYNQSAKHHEQLLKERREKREQEQHPQEQQQKHHEEIKQLPTPPKDEEKQDQEINEQQKEQEQKENNEQEQEQEQSTNNNEQKSNEQATIPNHTESHDNQDLKSVASTKTQKTTVPNNVPSAPGQKGHHGKKVIHGPYRLLRLLPHASRPILSRILEVDVSKRASMIDIFDDEWFDEIPSCTIDNKNNTVRAPGHHHTIVKDGKTYKI